MRQDIFISYSRHDMAVVLPFVERINRELGIQCWMDLHGIESGEQFEELIMQAIEQCQVVLFMLSNASLNSPWTKREIFYAEGEGKRIVPILIDGEKLRGWFKFHFGNIDYIDIRSDYQKNKLTDNLRSWLGMKAYTAAYAGSYATPIAHQDEDETAAVEQSQREAYQQHKEQKLHMIERNGKWGFADEAERVVISCKWKFSYSFSEGLACVQDSNDKWGFIDKTGKTVSPCKWKDAYSFCEGLACVKKGNVKLGFINDDKWGFIDKTGKLVIPCKWKSANSFRNGLALVQDSNGNSFYIDKTGKVVR